MSKRSGKWLVVAAVAGLCVGTWSWVSGPDEEEVRAESAKLMANHVWVDRMPEDERDLVRMFAPLKSSHGRVGVAGRVSAWRQMTDLFLWSLEDDRIAMYFGQEDVRWKARAKAWRCDKPGFDLCLEIWDDRHLLKLYSRDEWEVDPGAKAVPAAVVEAMPAVADAIEDALDEPARTAEPDDYTDAAEPPTWMR